MAVLCPFERFNQAELFALCANNTGCNISTFTSLEDACSMGDFESQLTLLHASARSLFAAQGVCHRDPSG